MRNPYRSARYRGALLFIVTLWLAVAPLSAKERTALDDYVAKPDPAYRYQLTKTIEGQGYTTYVIDMVSQTWLTAQEVNEPTWRHWLVIVKPEKVQGRTGLLFIGGGANGRKAPESVDQGLARMAQATGTVVAELRQVPNQPLLFAGEEKARQEDELVAYTWDKFLRTGDPKWPARLPMTKSAVRAMDTITAFCRALPGSPQVDRFVVAGGSKRGWTAWTTAAVDKRVVAVAPLVIDLLNLEKSFIHHFMVYGFWAPAVRDYQEMRIMDNWMGTPQFEALMKLVEPYSYLDRLTMPKFLVNSSGDQFFLPDSWKFYWRDLKGQKYLRYVPNTDHSLKNSDARESLLAFYMTIVQGREFPRFDWSVDKSGEIRVKAKTRPREVKLWQATNPEARDFRLDQIGPAWTSSNVTALKNGEYRALVPAPAKGWSAYFLELTFEGPAVPYKFTTGVVVTPDTTRFPSPLVHDALLFSEPRTE